MKKNFLMLLPLVFLAGGVLASCAPDPSSEEPSSSETTSSEETPSSSEEISSEEPSSEEVPSSSEEPSSEEVPSSSEESSSEVPPSSEEPEPDPENLIYFQDTAWWNDGGAGVSYILSDTADIQITAENFGKPGTHVLANNYLDTNYWSIDTEGHQYIAFGRIGTAGGNQPVRYWGGKTVVVDLSTRGENDCYTLMDTVAPTDLETPVTGSWKVYNPSEDPVGPPTGEILDVYFKAPTSWGTSINAYVWNNSAGNTLAGWPGSSMENVSGNLYKFSYDTTLYNSIIFNDGTNQTADLSSPLDPDMACYVFGKGWLATDTDEEPGDAPVTESGWYIVGEGSFVNGSTWNVAGGILMTVNENYEGVGTEYMAIGAKFATGDKWKLCSTENEWISNGWETESGALFSGDMSLIDDGYGGYNVGVNVTGSYDIYYKVYGNGTYSCWISEATI